MKRKIELGFGMKAKQKVFVCTKTSKTERVRKDPDIIQGRFMMLEIVPAFTSERTKGNKRKCQTTEFVFR